MEFFATTDTRSSLDLLGRVLNPDARPGSERDAALAVTFEWPLVVALASCHMVTPALYPRLGETGLEAPLDHELIQYFQTVTELNRDRNVRIIAQLVELADLLNRVGIMPIFLKGAAHLLLGLYREVGDRVIGDIDLLVDEKEFDKTIEVLAEAGYAAIEDDTEHAHHHHYPPLGRDGSEVCVEVHKDAAMRLYHRALPTSALIAQARTIQIEGKQAAVPCPEDLVVHNIIHSQLVDRDFWSAELSLRNAYDLVLLTRHFRDELDWPRLAARLTADVGDNCAGFYVRRAHMLFEQSPPPVCRPLGARLTDWRWNMHARGRMAWLQQVTRFLSYLSQGLLRIMESTAARRRLWRCLGVSGWYTARLRASTDTGWREAGRLD